MAIPSAALAYRRSALMTATKITAKPPSEEVLAARDDFIAFCTAMGKKPARHMLEWHAELCTGVDSECLLGIGGQNTAILAPRGSAKHCPWFVCCLDDWETCSCKTNSAHPVHRLYGGH